jgi:hypothetical protein
MWRHSNSVNRKERKADLEEARNELCLVPVQRWPEFRVQPRGPHAGSPRGVVAFRLLIPHGKLKLVL